MNQLLTNLILKKLITKYVIVLVVFTFISRIGINFLIEYFYAILDTDSLGTYSRMQGQMIILLASIVVNMGLALIVLADCPKKNRLAWLIFILTIISSSTGVVIFIIFRVMEFIGLTDSENQAISGDSLDSATVR